MHDILRHAFYVSLRYIPVHISSSCDSALYYANIENNMVLISRDSWHVNVKITEYSVKYVNL